MSDLVYFDIGANIGDTVKPFLNSKYIVHAFEPNPDCIAKISNRKDINFKNLYLNEVAVSDTPTDLADFYITGNDACSSLKEIKLNDKLANKYCCGNLAENRLAVKKKISVKVVRLDDYIKDKMIEKIDFIKIDAQGSDLDVIKSLGDELKICQKIKIECMFDGEDMYYKNECKKSDVINYLTSNGFKLIKQDLQHEWYFCDLFFENIK